MAKKLPLFAILAAAVVQAQTVTVLDMPANDLAYSNYTGKIYASVSTAASANANNIAKINPATGQIETYFPSEDDPGILAISGDGQLLYIGKTGTPSIQQFNLVTDTPGIEFSLGSEAVTGNYYAEDIEVMPGQSGTIAVARRNHNFAPRHEGVAIFDSGVMRPTTTRDHTGSNQIEFSAADQIVGFNNETTEYKFKKIAVSSGGAAVSSPNTQSGLPEVVGGANKFSIYGTKAYFTNGSVVDFAGTPSVASTLDAFGPSVFDPSTGAICYASYDMGGSIGLKFFDAGTGEFINGIAIPQASGNVKSLVACGNSLYAFCTANKIVIINYTLGNPSVRTDAAMLYPNPVKDLLYMDGVDLQSATFYNTLGQLVMRAGISGNSIDVSSLATGTYIVRLSGANAEMTRKLIKL